jgi:PD-(D/E)XK endonuclease
VDKAWTSRRQGDLGEVSAMQWLTSIGATVYIPLVHSPDCDLVADLDGKLIRVQVKTSTCREAERFRVALCTRGGNQSWNGVVKRIDASRCDFLFVHVGDGRRWFIPVTALAAGSGLSLGGPKYASYEIEHADPLPARPAPIALGSEPDQIQLPTLD